jgi:hypothetical protein
MSNIALIKQGPLYGDNFVSVKRNTASKSASLQPYSTILQLGKTRFCYSHKVSILGNRCPQENFTNASLFCPGLFRKHRSGFGTPYQKCNFLCNS